MTVHVSVPLDDKQAAQIEAIAAARAQSADAVLAEAVANFLDYEAWFVGEVEKGVASAKDAPLLDAEDVHARMRALVAKDTAAK